MKFNSNALTAAIALLIGLLPSGLLSAQDKNIYTYTSKSGITSFSDIEPVDVYYQLANVGCYACKTSSQVDWLATKLYHQAYDQEIRQAAKQYNVEVSLIKAIIHAESHFRANAVSKQGAQGLMQLMPATAEELGVSDPFVAKQNIAAGVKHLARLLKKYYGNISLAAAAYNAGETSVRKYQGVPPFPETRVYIERVEILRKRYKNANNV